MEILKNDSETLTATLVPANTTDDRTVTWSTNAEDVATVNQSGRVTGKKKELPSLQQRLVTKRPAVR